MTIDLDDVLRSGLRELVDEPDRSADELEGEVRSRVGRRRRRRRRWTMGVAAVAVVVLGVGIGVLVDDGSPDVLASKQPSPGAGSVAAPVRRVGVESVDQLVSLQGTEQLVVHFDGPLPPDPPAYVADIEPPDVSGLVYTTQPPDGLQVCGATHWFPGDQGTVDVLIPEAWLADPGPLDDDVPWSSSGGPPVKVIWCGPRDGYVQISIWGPVSDDPEDITVQVSADGTELIVDIEPQ